MRKYNQKIVSAMLAAVLAMFAHAAVPVYANDTNNFGNSVSVEITWDSLQFTYKDKAWNPQTHAYENGGWSTDGGKLTVTNNGSAEVAAEFAYASASGLSEVSGSFSETELTVPTSKSAETKLSLSGKPSRELNNETVGTVTVTIKGPDDVPDSGGDEGEWDIPKK